VEKNPKEERVDKNFRAPKRKVLEEFIFFRLAKSRIFNSKKLEKIRIEDFSLWTWKKFSLTRIFLFSKNVVKWGEIERTS